MVDTPCVAACITPAELTGATADADDDHVTIPLMSSVCPPLHMPVATSCCWFPTGTVGLRGVTAIETSPAREPVPDRLTPCGAVLALSVTVIFAVRVPCALGVKVADIWQVSPAANVFGDRGQFELTAKSPDVAMPKMVSATG
jgi:hypothetical protein